MMLLNSNSIRGRKVSTRDGDIGKISDLYFDDEAWTVRYAVVHDVGNWLEEKRVLINPRRITSVDPEHKAVEVDLTRAEVEASPPAESDQPLSECVEVFTFSHEFWPPLYESEQCSEGADVHLRSMEEVEGYAVAATDGDIGHVAGFIVDNEDWVVRYLVIDTRSWWPGRHVLVSPEWVDEVDWNWSKVRVNLERAAIKESPVYDPDELVSREYESDLCNFYNREGYWDRPC